MLKEEKHIPYGLRTFSRLKTDEQDLFIALAYNKFPSFIDAAKKTGIDPHPSLEYVWTYIFQERI